MCLIKVTFKLYCSNRGRVWDVLHVLLSRNFVSDLPTLKPKKTKNFKTKKTKKRKSLIFSSKKPRFLPALLQRQVRNQMLGITGIGFRLQAVPISAFC